MHFQFSSIFSFLLKSTNGSVKQHITSWDQAEPVAGIAAGICAVAGRTIVAAGAGRVHQLIEEIAGGPIAAHHVGCIRAHIDGTAQRAGVAPCHLSPMSNGCGVFADEGQVRLDPIVDQLSPPQIAGIEQHLRCWDRQIAGPVQVLAGIVAYRCAGMFECALLGPKLCARLQAGVVRQLDDVCARGHCARHVPCRAVRQ